LVAVHLLQQPLIFVIITILLLLAIVCPIVISINKKIYEKKQDLYFALSRNKNTIITIKKNFPFFYRSVYSSVFSSVFTSVKKYFPYILAVIFIALICAMTIVLSPSESTPVMVMHVRDTTQIVADIRVQMETMDQAISQLERMPPQPIGEPLTPAATELVNRIQETRQNIIDIVSNELNVNNGENINNGENVNNKENVNINENQIKE